MNISKNIDDREFEKFKEINNGETAVRTTDSSNFYLDISKGTVDGYSIFVMQGRNLSIDQGNTAEMGDLGFFNIPTIPITLYMSSNDVSDDQLILVQGLDSDYVEQVGIAFLNGQNQVEVKSQLGTSITWIRFFKAINIDSTSLDGEVYIAESDTLTNGVPDTDAKKQGRISFNITDNSNGQTFNAFFTIPAGKSATTTFGLFSVNRGFDVLINTQVRPFGGSFINAVPLAFFESSNPLSQSIFPPIIGEKSDLKFNLYAFNNDTQASVRADFVVIDNDFL